MNALLDAVQHPYAQLADALHAGADIASAHYEQDTAIPAVGIKPTRQRLPPVREALNSITVSAIGQY